jgi:hypothetical protein
MTIRLCVPTGLSGTVQTREGNTYTVGVDGTITVQNSEAIPLIAAGFLPYCPEVKHERFSAPIAAELVAVKAAATPANGAITLAAQIKFPSKLSVRIVLGTPGTTDITAGTLTLVGTNAQGQPVTEVISLVTGASVTRTTANVFATLTAASCLVAAYAANGSGTGNTLGIGHSTNLGLALPVGFVGLVVFKAMVDAVDEAVGTVDPLAGSIAPTTAANAAHNYDFWYSFGQPG